MYSWKLQLAYIVGFENLKTDLIPKEMFYKICCHNTGNRGVLILAACRHPVVQNVYIMHLAEFL